MKPLVVGGGVFVSPSSLGVVTIRTEDGTPGEGWEVCGEDFEGSRGLGGTETPWFSERIDTETSSRFDGETDEERRSHVKNLFLRHRVTFKRLVSQCPVSAHRLVSGLEVLQWIRGSVCSVGSGEGR